MRAGQIFNIFLLICVVKIGILLRLLPLSKEKKLSLGYLQESLLNFTEATAAHHYHSEEHTVVTEDGYVLSVFRITEAPKCVGAKKPTPVLVMHGVLQNSDVFLDAGPTAGLAYLLADDCFDVWLGNQRGNDYGRRHRTLDPDKDADFWKFSVDELALYDLPATIDYILHHTSAAKVNNIGVSQGAGVFFAMCSERPDYCEKTALMIAMAPAVVIQHTESLPIRFVCQAAERVRAILSSFGIQAVLNKGEFLPELAEYMCQFTGWYEVPCSTGFFLDRFHPGSISEHTRKVIFSHFPVGTSLQNLARYGQVIRSGKFQKFDYGEQLNKERYNTTTAPEYDLNSVSVPVLIIQGKDDKMVSIRDTVVLAKSLPNVLEMVLVSEPIWTHFDMVYSRNIKRVIYPKIQEYLLKYSDSRVL